MESGFKEGIKLRSVETSTSKLPEKNEAVKAKTNYVKKEHNKPESAFKIGDCVYVSSMNKRGIVCELENNKGEVGVMIMKNRFKINRKGLSLYIDSKEMYPEDYDFDVVLESKENRKKRKKMSKGHVEGLVIETNKG